MNVCEHSFYERPDFIKKFKNLNKFSTQSLEKLQSLTKKNFLLTNKKRHCFTELRETKIISLK